MPPAATNRNVVPRSRYRIHHRRDQRQSGTERIVSTRFAALRDDDVGAFLKHLARVQATGSGKLPECLPIRSER